MCAGTFEGDYFLDKRRKVIPCQAERMQRLFDQGWTYKELAEIFSCSKSQAFYAVNPDAEKRKAKRNKVLTAGGRYYNKEKATETVRRYRLRGQHKKSFLNNPNNTSVMEKEREEAQEQGTDKNTQSEQQSGGEQQAAEGSGNATEGASEKAEGQE